jgi:nitric oxide reductase NorD protein
VDALPPLAGRKSKPAQPVPLWLYPAPAAGTGPARKAAPAESEEGGTVQADAEKHHHQAERTELPENESPFLLMFRAESLLSWAEYVKVNRTWTRTNPDAADTAANMDRLHLAPDDGNASPQGALRPDPPAAAETIWCWRTAPAARVGPAPQASATSAACRP